MRTEKNYMNHSLIQLKIPLNIQQKLLRTILLKRTEQEKSKLKNFRIDE